MTKGEFILTASIILHSENAFTNKTSIETEFSGFTGEGYVTNFNEEDSYIKFDVNIEKENGYDLYINYRARGGITRNNLYIDEETYGEFICEPTDTFQEMKLCQLIINKKSLEIKIKKGWGKIDIDYIRLEPSKQEIGDNCDWNLNNPQATKECKGLMQFFKRVYGKGIITGQHTAASKGPEIAHIREVTGKLPAIRGFDFLSYSLQTETENPTDHKLIEIEENKESVEEAIKWHKEYNGIVTFCWHWYAPTGGNDKSFYTENTTFDLQTALVKGTKEYDALLADMDEIAAQLKRLQNENIPVLWRPLHEADGGWFWWGAKGPEAYKKLYKWMYDRFTSYHQLHNLIWVWNAPQIDWYPGDRYVDIAGVDTYVGKGEHGPLKCPFYHCKTIVQNKKPIALTENGPIPNPNALIYSNTPWMWYMPWYGEFVFDHDITSQKLLKEVYAHPYCVTLDQLPTFVK